MKFTTPVPIHSQDPKIDHHSRVFLAGSCFVENIGEKFDFYKLTHLRNPFGILYHPAAIENLISRVVSGYTYTQKDIFFHNERFHSFEAHSKLSNSSAAKLLEDLNTQLLLARQFLEQATHVILTPGTSWVYRDLGSANLVANCHKVPQKNFEKELSSVAEITRLLNSTITLLRTINPGVKIILTVSPVRHLKDGVTENQVSKAHLLAAVYQTLQDNPLHTAYFPSFEIVLDELRDYRFYAEDMLHPNAQAIAYIWEKFKQAWISMDSAKIFTQIERIQTGLAHRPFNENSLAHKNFLSGIHAQIEEVNAKFPHISFQ